MGAIGSMPTGKLIILKGGSSAGKTSLGRANLSHVSAAYYTWRSETGADGREYFVVEPGPILDQAMYARYRAIKAYLDFGLHVIADDVIWKRDWLVDMVRLFDGTTSHSSASTCPMPVEDVEGLAEGDVVLLMRLERSGGKGEIGPGADDLVVVGIVPDGPSEVRHDGELEHDLLGLLLGDGLLVSHGLLLLLQVVDASHQPIEIKARAASELLLEGADLVGELPLCGAEGLGFGLRLAPSLVGREPGIDQFRTGNALDPRGLLDCLRV
jgi:hypothetical protein